MKYKNEKPHLKEEMMEVHYRSLFPSDFSIAYRKDEGNTVRHINIRYAYPYVVYDGMFQNINPHINKKNEPNFNYHYIVEENQKIERICWHRLYK